MKAEVYSWRVSTELKTEIEREAQRRDMSVSKVLEVAIRQWLENSDVESDDEDRQRQLQDSASRYFGTFAGKDARRSENSRKILRERLKLLHGR